jgi:hypothetical protein
MKKTDYIGIIFFILFALLVMFFPWNFGLNPNAILKGEIFYWTGFEWSKLENFGNVTKEFPYIMGFLKFAVLATFGEMLKNRLKNGSWYVSKLPVRALVWGFFGIIMTIAFSLFASGTAVMMSGNLWFGSNPLLAKGFWNDLIFAFSTSLFMNMIFAYPMMFSHEWFSQVIEKGKLIGGEEFFAGASPKVWGSFIPKTILFFWVPAHTVTFLLPAEFRVLVGALLSVALGFILTIKTVKKA